MARQQPDGRRRAPAEMPTCSLRILHTTVQVPVHAAYVFAHRPENFVRWASGLAQTLHRTEDGWRAVTPDGEATVQFSEHNPHGVLDHWVHVPGRPVVYVPLRLLANGDGTEVELVLFRQPHMSDDDFERDAALVSHDLARLKALLEDSV